MGGGCGAATGSPETFPQAGALQQDLVEGMGGVVGENGGLCPAVGKGERQSMFKGARQEGDGKLGSSGTVRMGWWRCFIGRWVYFDMKLVGSWGEAFDCRRIETK